MLLTRILTAVALLAVLLPIFYFASFEAFAVVAALFLGAAIWEAMRLFGRPNGLIAALLWVGGFGFSLYWEAQGMVLYGLCVAMWTARWVPALGMGLPPLAHRRNRMLSMLYMVSIFACFFAMAELFRRSPGYLLSVLVVVWLADSGAYFVGRAIGKHKLAPSISPGKSWEGAIGGAVVVLLAGVASVMWGGEALRDTFVVQMQRHLGYGGMLSLLLLVVAASVVGDLVESQLKRRGQIKDSSNLLPGHGGVLDRIDALIPVLPLAALINAWLVEPGSPVWMMG